MNGQKIIAILRPVLGFVFFWAFLDKLFGLGFPTVGEEAWLAGASPTAGFLQYGTEGPMTQLFQALAGNEVVDWLFMLGLLGIGLGLMLGIMVRIAACGGIALMILIYLSLMPPENNPIIDEHVVYGLLLLYFAIESPSGWWSRIKLALNHPWLA